MFLTKENKIDNTSISGYQLLYEHETVWNNLMTEIAYEEHLSIINEDSQILLENKMTEWLNKVKRWFQWMAAEFSRYLTKIADWWTKIQARFRSWYLDDDIKKKLKNNEIEISGRNWYIIERVLEIVQKYGPSACKNEIDRILDCIDKKVEINENDQVVQTVQAMTTAIQKEIQNADSMNNEETTLNSSKEGKLKQAFNFIKDQYPDYIKNLVYCKDQVVKAANSAIKNDDQNTNSINILKRNISRIKETLSKWISYVNRCIKAIIDAFSKLKKEGNAEEEAAKNDGNNPKTQNPQQTNSQMQQQKAATGNPQHQQPVNGRFLFESKRVVDYFD